MAAIVALAACTPASPPAAGKAETAAALTCEQTLTKTIALSAPGAADVLTVRSIAAPPITDVSKDADRTEGGKMCQGATLVLTLHRASDNALLLSHAEAMSRLDMVGPPGPAFTPDALKAFLAEWAALEVTTSDATPALGETVTSALPAVEVAALKAKKLPTVCLMETVHDRACYVADPDQSGALRRLLTQDVS